MDLGSHGPSGVKRKQSEIEMTSDSGSSFDLNNSTTQNKSRAKEGFSWWTCLMYDMSMEKTKPHRIPNSPRENCNPKQ
ncbi:hypothetical protein ACJMK2_041269 [Sinanodonta woodiana]|uniref:Uncharacterized protein n=1 Tax=Sinanodonta woodiana TaxID=1069815 RepID=A0ABD3W6W9_SINWO